MSGPKSIPLSFYVLFGYLQDFWSCALKGYETQSISAIHAVLNGHILAPMAASEDILINPPLYYWTGAILGKLLTPLISLHDASRMINALWMGLTILMIGMLNRELWGTGFGRQAALIFIGSVGLIFNVHTLMPGIATLTGLTMAFYGLALSKRRPFRSALLLGFGLGISFLSGGIMPLLILILSSLLLPMLFQVWRTRRYALVLSLSLLVSLPFLIVWPALLWWYQNDIFMRWINHFQLFQTQNYIFISKIFPGLLGQRYLLQSGACGNSEARYGLKLNFNYQLSFCICINSYFFLCNKEPSFLNAVSNSIINNCSG